MNRFLTLVFVLAFSSHLHAQAYRMDISAGVGGATLASTQASDYSPVAAFRFALQGSRAQPGFGWAVGAAFSSYGGQLKSLDRGLRFSEVSVLTGPMWRISERLSLAAPMEIGAFSVQESGFADRDSPVLYFYDFRKFALHFSPSLAFDFPMTKIGLFGASLNYRHGVTTLDMPTAGRYS